MVKIAGIVKNVIGYDPHICSFKFLTKPVPVAARSKVWVYGLSPAAIVGSNPTGAWIFVCCVLLGRGLCDELITRPEESYRRWRVVVCDQETSLGHSPQWAEDPEKIIFNNSDTIMMTNLHVVFGLIPINLPISNII
jgi:hypothetical protein